jgi:hypothetical protein
MYHVGAKDENLKELVLLTFLNIYLKELKKILNAANGFKINR